MKIAILAYSLDRNNAGISQYTRQLIMHLKKEHELTVVHLKKSDDPVYDGVKEILIPKIFHTSMLIRLYMNLFLRNPDVEVIYHPGPIGYFIKPKVPLVQSVHDLKPLKFPHLQNFVNRWAYRILTKWYIRTADSYVTLSESSKKDICSMLKVPPEKVFVTYLASSYSMPSDKEILRVKEKYSISYPYFIFVSTLAPSKNVVRMLEAFAKSGLPQHFVLVGSRDWKSEEVFEAIDRLKLSERVHVLEKVPNEDISGLYAASHALVFASLYEGFGLPIVEAMACGCPVIASNISSIPEVGGDAVLYVDPYDVDSIASAMKNVGSCRDELIRKGFEQAKKFSYEKTVVASIEAFNAAVNIGNAQN